MLFDIYRLSQYVNDTVQSSELVSLLLPFLLPKVNRSPPIELSITHAIRNLLEKADTTSQFIRFGHILFSNYEMLVFVMNLHQKNEAKNIYFTLSDQYLSCFQRCPSERRDHLCVNV